MARNPPPRSHPGGGQELRTRLQDTFLHWTVCCSALSLTGPPFPDSTFKAWINEYQNYFGNTCQSLTPQISFSFYLSKRIPFFNQDTCPASPTVAVVMELGLVNQVSIPVSAEVLSLGVWFLGSLQKEMGCVFQVLSTFLPGRRMKMAEQRDRGTGFPRSWSHHASLGGTGHMVKRTGLESHAYYII